ncbi:GNAT family N-acetyltransferase [Massilia endophytica]|uniref:GNAT family N-acetyltransferase n=1 Tax=Massilia endophytica TaxID=2899220 RepID=UPI001E570C82|nr:GNAT family N-acetyltransferase [Massilia endophytica]UGQ44988.1 GNAT family N-acetyltransferase [Massilia endophytica]
MATRTPRTIEMRAAEPADQAFMEQLYALTRGDVSHMEGCDASTGALLLSLLYRARQSHFEKLYPYADLAIITEHELPIGRLYVNYSQDEIRIIDMSLLPECRNRGIGLGLLRSLQAQGVRMRVPLHVDVLLGSPAQRLLQRCGFVSQGSNGVYNAMSWQAPG